MNPILELDFWTCLVGVLALEILCVIALAFLVQLLTRSAFWRRTIWQISFVCILLLTATEITGVGRGISIWLAGKPVPEQIVSVRMIPVDEQFISVPMDFEMPEPIFIPQEEVPTARSIWWPGILWFAGLGLIAARILFARVLFIVLRLRNRRMEDLALLNRVYELAKHLGIIRRIRLLESAGLTSPVAFGIVQPSIGLPLAFAKKFNPAQQNAMLTHELAHLAARDPFWYLLADCAAAIFWWHPAIWFARRRLHSASEHAADEAAAILENGPGTLAECLVNLGQQMTGGRSFGWLGVEGNGFRSHLGQRVERLLNLKEARQPLRGWKIFLAKTSITVLFAAIVIFTSGWIQNKEAQRPRNLKTAFQQSWDASFASLAVTALAENKTEFASQSDSRDSFEVLLYEYEIVSFDTVFYDDVSAEQFEIISRRGLELEDDQGILILSSNELSAALLSLSELPSTYDLVGSKFSGGRFLYHGAMTNDDQCTYLTRTINGISRIEGAEMTYASTNPWSFSFVPRKLESGIQIDLEWPNAVKNLMKGFEMPNDGGAIVRRAIPGDPTRHQLILFSSVRVFSRTQMERETDIAVNNSNLNDEANRASNLNQFGEIPITNKEEPVKDKATELQNGTNSIPAQPPAKVASKSLSYLEPLNLDKLYGNDLFPKPALTLDELRTKLKGDLPLPSARLLPSASFQETKTPAEIPVLGDLPFVGRLFRGTNSPHSDEVKGTNGITLYTRVFKTNPEKFMATLENVFPEKAPEELDLSTPSFGGRINDHAGIIQRIRKFFSAAGVDFGSIGSTNANTKALFYKDTTGLLMVRATLEDLEIIQTAIDTLNVEPAVPEKNPNLKEKIAVGSLVQEGKILFEAGKLEKADALLDSALKLDEKNPAALYYKSLVRESKERPRSTSKSELIYPTIPPEPVKKSPEKIVATNLYTRTFKIDPNAFNELAGTKFQETNLNQVARDFFQAAGVDFGSAGNPNGKALFFKDTIGLLMVRATMEDLENIQTAIEALTSEPPQVTIEAKFVEMDGAASREIDWSKLGGTGARMITNLDSGFKLLDGMTNWPKAFPNQSLSNSIAQNFITTLTRKQFETLIEQLQKQAGTDVLSCPKVTTTSRRQTQISVENQIKIRPSSATVDVTIASGPVLDVIAHVSSDGYSIQIPVTATVKEIVQEERGILRRKTPVARIRQMSTTANIFDGQTLVLGEMTTDTKTGGEKCLFVFVTATIIDAKGNRVHTEEDVPFSTNSVPRQP